MMQKNFNRFARAIADFTGSPYAFGAALLIIVTWFIISSVFFRFNEVSQLFINTLTTIITFLMVFLIQHTNDIDTKALHTKIDELIRVHNEADDDLINLERRSS